MSEENRFFRIVWRIDAILLAVAGILLIGLLSVVAATELFWQRYSPAPEGQFAPVPKSAEQDNTYRLASLPDVASFQSEQFYALQRWNGSPRSYGLSMELLAPSASTYRYNNAVNVLAVDTSTGKSHWLFGGYHRAVADQQSIYSGGPAQGDQAVKSSPIALVIRTIDKDSNGDGEMDSRDRQSLYYYRAGDNQASRFFDADYIISAQEIDGGDFFVVYEKARSAFAARFHVPDFKLLSQRPLPNVPQ